MKSLSVSSPDLLNFRLLSKLTEAHPLFPSSYSLTCEPSLRPRSTPDRARRTRDKESGSICKSAVIFARRRPRGVLQYGCVRLTYGVLHHSSAVETFHVRAQGSRSAVTCARRRSRESRSRPIGQQHCPHCSLADGNATADHHEHSGSG